MANDNSKKQEKPKVRLTDEQYRCILACAPGAIAVAKDDNHAVTLAIGIGLKLHDEIGRNFTRQD